MTAEQKDIYACHFRIQLFTMQLQIPNIALLQPHHHHHHHLPPSSSPSSCRTPRVTFLEPEYDSHGVRANTRVKRRRDVLKPERHDLVARPASAVPGYQAPTDYRRLPAARLTDRMFIPQHEHSCIKSNRLNDGGLGGRRAWDQIFLPLPRDALTPGQHSRTRSTRSRREGSTARAGRSDYIVDD